MQGETVSCKDTRGQSCDDGEPSLMQWWWTSTDGAQEGRTKELNYVKVALSGVWRLLLFFSSPTAEHPLLLVIKMWRTIKMEDKKTMIKMEALRRIIEAIVSILPPVDNPRRVGEKTHMQKHI